MAYIIMRLLMASEKYDEILLRIVWHLAHIAQNQPAPFVVMLQHTNGQFSVKFPRGILSAVCGIIFFAIKWVSIAFLWCAKWNEMKNEIIAGVFFLSYFDLHFKLNWNMKNSECFQCFLRAQSLVQFSSTQNSHSRFSNPRRMALFMIRFYYNFYDEWLIQAQNNEFCGFWYLSDET